MIVSVVNKIGARIKCKVRQCHQQNMETYRELDTVVLLYMLIFLVADCVEIDIKITGIGCTVWK